MIELSPTVNDDYLLLVFAMMIPCGRLFLQYDDSLWLQENDFVIKIGEGM